MSEIQQAKDAVNTAYREIEAAAALLQVEPRSRDAQAQIVGCLAGRLARMRELLQSMLNVAENCDETGYADGVGFVDLDKLHAEVRAALKP